VNGQPLDHEKQDDSKVATSRDTSSASSPAPSIHRTESEIDGRTVISFDENDKTNPYNWPVPKKMYVVLTGMLMVLNSTLGSALPSGATKVVQRYFDVKSEELLVLPVSVYLIGYILGPMIFAPLSESYGRKIVMICTFIMFTAFVLGTALSPNFASYVVFRLLAGIGASTPVSVIGGIYADLYSTPRARGFAITAFMAGTTWGPLGGPLISGYVSEGVSWQWVYWIELIVVGFTWPFLLGMPETYGPVILKSKAKKMRKETGNPNIIAPSDLEKQDLRQLVVVVLTRPIRMFLFEAIVLCTCLYLSLAYGIFYSEPLPTLFPHS
jgi:multidrug resistance protein